MKKLISILIIFVLLFSMVYSEETGKDSQKESKEKKYWAEGEVDILRWKIKKDKVKITFAMKNKKGNIPIKSYKIKFRIIYERGLKDFHDYSCTESHWIKPYSKKVKKFEVPLKFNKEIESIFVEKLEYKTLETEKWERHKTTWCILIILGVIVDSLLVAYWFSLYG